LQGLGRIGSSILVTGVILNFLLIGVLLFIQPTTANSVAHFYALLSLGAALFAFFFFLLPQLAIYKGEVVRFKLILGSCMPLLLVIITQLLVQWSGIFIAGVYLEAKSISLLASAQRTAMLVSFVLVVVNLVVAPRFALLYEQGELWELETLALTSVKLITVLAFPLIILMVCFPGEIMALFGPEFVAGGPLLRILAVGQFINAVCGSVGILLIMSGNEQDVRNVSLLSGAFSLVSVWVLTVYFGESGNAMGTAAVVAGQNLLTVYFVKKRLGFNTLAVWR
jgi:O-antigen/teichoic acid export membrane protein